MAAFQDVGEDGGLVCPMAFELGRAIKPDLADIPRPSEQFLKQRQLGLPLMRELWMQAERGPDPRSPVR